MLAGDAFASRDLAGCDPFAAFLALADLSVDAFAADFPFAPALGGRFAAADFLLVDFFLGAFTDPRADEPAAADFVDLEPVRAVLI